MQETFDKEDMVNFANWCRQFKGVVIDEAALKDFLVKQETLLKSMYDRCPECDRRTPFEELDQFDGLCEACYIENQEEY